MKKSLSVILVAAAMLSSGALAQKQTPPEGGTAKDFVLPKKKVISLPNGIDLTLVPYGVVPKVSVSVVIRSGNLNEAEAEVWVADILGDMMKEGTTQRSASKVAEDASGMGGNVNVAVGPDLTTFSGDVLSEYGPSFLKLLGEIVRQPLLPESEFARIKNDRIRQLSIEKSQPQALAQEEFLRMMYPGHPYGRAYPLQENLEKLSIDVIRAFYTKNIGAQRTAIFVAGVFDAQAIESAAREAFSSWERGPAPLINIPKHAAKQAFGLVERPGAPQSTIYFGIPVVNPADKDYVKMVVTNSLLGGSFASRITTNIREKKGYTYSPYSQVSTRYRDAYWVEVADVGTEVTGPALKEIIGEINRLQSDPPPADELKGIQNYLAGTFVLQNSSRQGIIGQFSTMRLHGLPDSYLASFVKNVHAVSPADVQQTTETYLRDEDMTLVIVGDKKQVEEQIKEFMKIDPERK